MTSIGKSEFPEMTLSEAIEVIEGVKREKAQTTAGLGKVMGLTNVTTGFFYSKIASLSKYYGFIDRSKTNVTLTHLAKRIVYPVSDSDRDAAIHEAASRVGLLKDLYAALGPDYHELDFPAKLLDLTQASHEEIAEKAPRIERVYRDAIVYLGTSPATQTAFPTTSPRGTVGGSTRPSGMEAETGVPSLGSTDPGEFWIFQDGDTYVRVRKEKKKLQIVKGVLEVWMREHEPADNPERSGQQG